MNGSFVVVDVINRRFVQCWTENDTVFLSKDISNAETYSSAERAKECARDYQKNAWRFLADEDEQEVDNVQLVACQVEAKFKFNPC